MLISKSKSESNQLYVFLQSKVCHSIFYVNRATFFIFLLSLNTIFVISICLTYFFLLFLHKSLKKIILVLQYYVQNISYVRAGTLLKRVIRSCILNCLDGDWIATQTIERIHSDSHKASQLHRSLNKNKRVYKKYINIERMNKSNKENQTKQCRDEHMGQNLFCVHFTENPFTSHALNLLNSLSFNVNSVHKDSDVLLKVNYDS